jgi:sec-independent protein translocase protein TatB
MFDIGFSEIVVIAVVALVVLGPEKLPKTARTLGHLFGRLQRYVNDVKSDIKREIDLDELRKLQQNVQTAAKEFETSMVSATQGVESSVRDVGLELNAAAGGATSETPVAPTLPPQLAPVAAPTPPIAAPTPPAPDSARQGSLPGFDRG